MTAIRSELDEEAQDQNWAGLLDRLSRQSVDKHFEAYVDVPWDDPAFEIDPLDSRWELRSVDPLGHTAWYQSLPQPTRARLGLAMVASKMKTGLDFENVLKRGLLEYAACLPNGSKQFRYVYHEVIEEAHHGLMFQEFVNRSGFSPNGIPWHMRPATNEVVKLGRRFPALFFVFVLGGEDPIDHVQREAIRHGDVHPLLERIMRIHITEEARHLSYARHYLKRHVPRFGFVRKTVLSIGAPIILGEMSRLMLRPSPQIVREFGIPRSVIAEAYDNDDARRTTIMSLRKVRNLLQDLGLVTPISKPIWKIYKIWEAPASANP